ncbi:hypothetical protein VTJ04DRAFT_8935 [Mycothermus thermophilus]|uniref:uncharacterized protein n=1 Tax=Humicola insolens TaxID=85995 RepID=UPI003741F3DF
MLGLRVRICVGVICMYIMYLATNLQHAAISPCPEEKSGGLDSEERRDANHLLEPEEQQTTASPQGIFPSRSMFKVHALPPTSSCLMMPSRTIEPSRCHPNRKNKK